MSVQGVKAITKAFKAHEKAVFKGFRVGLLRAGLFLQRESQKLVPIDTGDLRRSADTREEIDTKAGTHAVTVSYGTNYALFVHENLEARHKPGRQAKFLEQPLREHRGRLAEIVAEAMKDF